MISIYTLAAIYLLAFWTIAAIGGSIGDAIREEKERNERKGNEHDER